jgi:hypothetical protein
MIFDRRNLTSLEYFSLVNFHSRYCRQMAEKRLGGCKLCGWLAWISHGGVQAGFEHTIADFDGG